MAVVGDEARHGMVPEPSGSRGGRMNGKKNRLLRSDEFWLQPLCSPLLPGPFPCPHLPPRKTPQFGSFTDFKRPSLLEIRASVPPNASTLFLEAKVLPRPCMSEACIPFNSTSTNRTRTVRLPRR